MTALTHPGGNLTGFINLEAGWACRCSAWRARLMAKKIWPSPTTLGCNSNVTVLLTLLQKPLHGMYFAVHRRRAYAGRLRRDAHPPRFSAESFVP